MTRKIEIRNFAAPSEGKGVRVDAEGVPVAVFLIRGNLFAIDATCTHERGPLERGRISSTTVQCPWHGSIFSVENGKVLQGPATAPVRSYRARAEGTNLILETD